MHTNFSIEIQSPQHLLNIPECLHTCLRTLTYGNENYLQYIVKFICLNVNNLLLQSLQLSVSLQCLSFPCMYEFQHS